MKLVIFEFFWRNYAVTGDVMLRVECCFERCVWLKNECSVQGGGGAVEEVFMLWAYWMATKVLCALYPQRCQRRSAVSNRRSGAGPTLVVGQIPRGKKTREHHSAQEKDTFFFLSTMRLEYNYAHENTLERLIHRCCPRFKQIKE